MIGTLTPVMALHHSTWKTFTTGVTVNIKTSHSIGGRVVHTSGHRSELDFFSGLSKHPVGVIFIDGNLGNIVCGGQKIINDNGGCIPSGLLLTHLPHALIDHPPGCNITKGIVRRTEWIK